MATDSNEPLNFVVNHVVLPPQLPDSRESENIARQGHNLLVDILENQVKEFSQRIGQQGPWRVIERTLQRIKVPVSDPELSVDLVKGAFQRLKSDGRLQEGLVSQLANVEYRCYDNPASKAECSHSLQYAERPGRCGMF